MTRSLTTLFGSALAGLLLVAAPLPASAATPALGSQCAWPTEISPEALNIALPDTNARY
jgi:hypothetical protein